MELIQLQRIFHPKPDQWGLRGDPYLWQELEYVCTSLQLPGSAAEIDSLLQCLYLNLVGEALAHGRQPFVARYQGGGMSSGHLEANFWLERGFPLLKSRMLDLLSAAQKQRQAGAFSKHQTQARPLPNSYWATPAVLGCEYPGDLKLEAARDKLSALLNAGITDFFDLTESHELKPYEKLLYQLAAERNIRVHYQRFSIRDIDIPTPETLEAVLAGLAATVAAGRKAVVHCWGGVGRTGTIIGCYLVRHQQMTGSESLAYIAREWQSVAKSHRKPKSPETTAQYQLVQNFQ
ncbi:MAG: hypothetical protein EOO61_15710 [Hymenobacter sp.]|nr:MAG: hypothetical protein EOO61_15710 [Hymenobacter sp.]